MPQDMSGFLSILCADEIKAILDGDRASVIEAVSNAYKLHAQGKTSLPQSTFLCFPHLVRNRIIALPAYVGGGMDAAGIKWIASAPDNIHKGLERASALIALNDADTGRPRAILEGSHISAARTAASAALAAKLLHQYSANDCVGFVGCGRINFEIAHYLRDIFPDICAISLFDLDGARMGQFAECLGRIFPTARPTLHRRLESLLSSSRLISIATTASVPHIQDLRSCPPASTILHISLRDLSPETILSSDNVVDDFEHVCRAQTSIQLARDLSGQIDFVACSVGEILNGTRFVRSSENANVVFSPFGLGILDIAVAALVCQKASEQSIGFELPSFLPLQPWDAPMEVGAGAALRGRLTSGSDEL